MFEKIVRWFRPTEAERAEARHIAQHARNVAHGHAHTHLDGIEHTHGHDHSDHDHDHDHDHDPA